MKNAQLKIENINSRTKLYKNLNNSKSSSKNFISSFILNREKYPKNLKKFNSKFFIDNKSRNNFKIISEMT